MMKTIETPYKTINCPQCGDALPLYFAHTKLAQCASCGSSIFLEDDAARLAGEQSVLAPEPSLMKLGSLFTYGSKTYLTLGMIRYSYGRGFWEEWWLKDSENESYWLSVDEGDMVLEKEVESDMTLETFSSLKMGQAVGSEWIVTELGIGRCEGFVGSLPKLITIGTQYKYAHLSGYSAKLKTVEVGTTGMETFVGKWINPFDIKLVMS